MTGTEKEATEANGDQPVPGDAPTKTFECPEVVSVPSWEAFSSTVNSRIGELLGDDYVFRGQGSSHYELTSSFDRKFHDSHSFERRRAIDRRLEELFKEIAELNDVPLSSSLSLDLGLGQHYGLATRLLDWSESRYVAAFFAFAGLERRLLSSLDAEEEKDSCVSVFALDIRAPLIDDERLELITPNYSTSNNRLRRQRGLFTRNKTDHATVESYINQFLTQNPGDCSRAPLLRFDLPVAEARRALRDLQEMRISYSELFPGVEGVAQEAMLSEWMGKRVRARRHGGAPELL